MAEPPLCLPPVPLARRPSERLPEGSCDCHFHVFTPTSRLSPQRSYTPPTAPLEQWLAFADAVGLDRGVLVQPSVYGTDNEAMIEALALAPDRLRGVAVIAPETRRDEIARMHQAGVRGVRLNLMNPGGLPIEAVPELTRLIAPFGWHLQFLVRPDRMDLVRSIAAEGAVPVVVDHLGLSPVDRPGLEPALASLQRLLDTGRSFVKVSAPYRLGSATGSARAAMQLSASHPERLVWGSDWPHSDLYENVPDDADLIADLLATFAAPDLRQRLLVETPTQLYWT